MSSATPVADTPGAVSVESLLEKYDLPEGTNADALARVLARLGDLPMSSAEKSTPGGEEPRGELSSGTRVNASTRRNQMRFTSGGEPVARVSWSPSSPGGTRHTSSVRSGESPPEPPATPGGDPLALIQDLYGDDVDETVRASAMRALTAAGYGSPATANGIPAAATPTAGASASRLADPQPSASRSPRETARPDADAARRPGPATGALVSIDTDGRLKKPPNTVALTAKETMGKLGELRYEARAANQRARRAERALRTKDQELEEIKAKCASLARERSSLSARIARDSGRNTAALSNKSSLWSGTSCGSSALAPPSADAGFGVRFRATDSRTAPKSPFSTTPRKPSGESLSMSTRWNQWEMDARRGDTRLAMLMRGYKKKEAEVEAAREAARVARETVAFSEDEVEATRSALEELRGNFEAAKELLNEGLETREALEQKVRAASLRNARLLSDLEVLKAQNARLESEKEASREKTKECLRRAVKRDRRIEALTKKLKEVEESNAVAEKAREKAEEESMRVDERCHELRRRVATLEAEAKVRRLDSGEADERAKTLALELEAAREENQKFAAELDIKEEECNMLAAMVSRASTSGRGSVSRKTNSSANGGGVSEGVAALPAAL